MDEEAKDVLRRKIKETEELLARYRTAYNVIVNGAGVQPIQVLSSGGKTYIAQICEYLKQAGGPVHQGKLIGDIVAERQTYDLSQKNHYSAVWRALGYLMREGNVQSVDAAGKRTKLKPLPPRPKGMRKVPDDPSLYFADNYFVFKDDPGEQEGISEGDQAEGLEGS